MTRSLRKAGLAAALIAVPTALTMLYSARVDGSDHADTVENVQRPGADISDVFIFPKPDDASRVVLVMCVRPLIPAGQANAVSFDPDVLYQFKIDNSATLDGVEDVVIQARFGAPGPNQTVSISGPAAPGRTGLGSNIQLTVNATRGVKGTPFNPVANMRVFAGPRKDPFFIDLDRFLIEGNKSNSNDPQAILPDRGVPAGLAQPPADPNRAQTTTFRNPGVDFLANMNVLSIVVELPKNQIARRNGNTTVLGKIGLWTTTSVRN